MRENVKSFAGRYWLALENAFPVAGDEVWHGVVVSCFFDALLVVFHPLPEALGQVGDLVGAALGGFLACHDALDFDGEYDRYDWTRLEDMRPVELEAVLRWLKWDSCGVEAEDLLRAWFEDERNSQDIDDRLLFWLEEDEEDEEE